MVYHPTAKQHDEDLKLRKALELFGKSYCESEKMSSCNINGGARTKKTKKPSPSSEHLRSSSTEGSHSPKTSKKPQTAAQHSPSSLKGSRSPKTSKKPQTAAQQASSICDRPEEYRAYETIAKLIIIGGTAGSVATGLAGIFSGYADTLLHGLGLPNLKLACGNNQFFISETLSNVVPGMQSCADVTRKHEQFVASAWGTFVVLSGYFGVNMPSNISQIPSRLIENTAKALCRYFKTRQIDAEMRAELLQKQRDTDANTKRQIEDAVRQALRQQGNSIKNSKSASKSHSPLHAMAAANQEEFYQSPKSRSRSSSISSSSSVSSSSSKGRRSRSNSTGTLIEGGYRKKHTIKRKSKKSRSTRRKY